MKAPRTHLEMIPVVMDEGWQPLAGFPGLDVKVLADDLDEAAKKGARTRLVRFAPGAATRAALEHPYWEEALLIAGDLSPAGASGDKVPSGLRYCCRPPGTPHGPVQSHNGCVLLETHYFLPV